ncbi:MAG: OsmC family protein [Saprospiraceae bacterium]|nr:OsmC family protein [Saprospiraceae bacterium]
MKINIRRIDDDFQMEAVNAEGNKVIMDGSLSIGGHNRGMRPMQLLLTAIGGCSSIDVINILKKQKQEISDFEVEVEGLSVPVEEYSRFSEIVVHFKIRGKVDPKKAEKAAQLSFQKYCSVSKALEPTSDIRFKVSVNE